MRVSVQLIDARTGSHLWAEQYDRDVADVVAIQSEIAQQIADQLRSKLSPAERKAIAERPTADLAAYALYTKAMSTCVRLLRLLTRSSSLTSRIASPGWLFVTQQLAQSPSSSIHA